MSARLRLRLPALLVAAALLGMPAAGAAQQQGRIPSDALTGRLAITQFPRALLDGREVVLAPGVRIRAPDNLLRMPTTVTGEPLVRYRLDPVGLVIEVWLLTDEEAAAAARNPGGSR